MGAATKTPAKRRARPASAATHTGLITEDAIEGNRFLVRYGDSASQIRFSPTNGVLNLDAAVNLAIWLLATAEVSPAQVGNLLRRAAAVRAMK
jgi:hypothetical protein